MLMKKRMAAGMGNSFWSAISAMKTAKGKTHAAAGWERIDGRRNL
jgi:hypothetical protein